MFAELKMKPFIPITTTVVLEPPTIVVPTPNTEDSTVLAIDLSVKHPSDTIGTSVIEHNSASVETGSDTSQGDPSARLPTLPSTTENNATTSSASDINTVMQPASGAHITEVNPIPDTRSELSSVSDSLLSPSKPAALPTHSSIAQHRDDHVLGSNQNDNVLGKTQYDCKDAKHYNSMDNDCNMMGTNIVVAEGDINTQKFILKKDKYKDAPLSGTFECIHTNKANLQDVLHALGLPQNSSQNTDQPSSKDETVFMDHAYSCVMEGGLTRSLSINPESDIPNEITEEDIVICGLTELTISNEDVYEPIEVSMVIEDMSQQILLAIPGTNTEQSNVSSSYPRNDERSCSPTSLGTNNHAIPGINQVDFSNSSTPTSTSRLDTNVSHVPGVNSTLTTMHSNAQSSSSSDFNGFNSDDIAYSTPLVVCKQSTIPSSSSSEFEGFHSDDIYEVSSQYQLTTSEESSIPSTILDSDDTVIYPATSKTTVKRNMPNQNCSQQFYLTKQINDQYNPEIISLWKNDAMKKKMDCSHSKPE